jgi:hypothetical protein
MSVIGGAASRTHPAVAATIAAVGTWFTTHTHLFNAMLADMYASDLCDCGVAVTGRCFGEPPGGSGALFAPGAQPITKTDIKALLAAIPQGGYRIDDIDEVEGEFEDLTFDGE